MDTIATIQLFTIAVLIIASAIFSASETSLTTVNPATVHQMSKNKHRGASLVAKLLLKKERLICTILTGNTLVNILISSFATEIAINTIGSDYILTVALITTAVVLIFAEVIPKTYAIKKPQNTAYMLAPPMYACLYLLYPVTSALQLLIKTVNKIIKIPESGEIHNISDVIKGMISLHKHNQSWSKENLQLLENITNLTDLQVQDIMTHKKNMFALDINSNTQDLIVEALQSPFNEIPIWENHKNNIIGILYIRDLITLTRNQKPQNHNTIRNILHPPWFTPENAPLNTQISNFKKNKSSCAIVVDEYGEVQGIITLHSIMTEIIGNIEDHIKTRKPMLIKHNEHNYTISGSWYVRDLNKELKWTLPDLNATTISGMVINHAEKFPNENEVFYIENYIVHVLKTQHNIITELKITKVDEDEEEDDQ